MKSCCPARPTLPGTRLLTSVPLSSAGVAAAPLPHIYAGRGLVFWKVHPWKVLQVILLTGSYNPYNKKGFKPILEGGFDIILSFWRLWLEKCRQPLLRRAAGARTLRPFSLKEFLHGWRRLQLVKHFYFHGLLPYAYCKTDMRVTRSIASTIYWGRFQTWESTRFLTHRYPFVHRKSLGHRKFQWRIGNKYLVNF